MTRVSLSLGVIDLPFDAADPFYTHDRDGKLEAYYVPTPGLMRWFIVTIESALASDLSPQDRADAERMRRVIDSLLPKFPAGPDPIAPDGDDPEDFALVSAFLEQRHGQLLTVPEPGDRRHFRKRRVVAWRPTELPEESAGNSLVVSDDG